MTVSFLYGENGWFLSGVFEIGAFAVGSEGVSGTNIGTCSIKYAVIAATTFPVMVICLFVLKKVLCLVL